jgi:hypothetical protein
MATRNSLGPVIFNHLGFDVRVIPGSGYGIYAGKEVVQSISKIPTHLPRHARFEDIKIQINEIRKARLGRQPRKW